MELFLAISNTGLAVTVENKKLKAVFLWYLCAKQKETKKPTTFGWNSPASSQIRDCMAELKSATQKEVFSQQMTHRFHLMINIFVTKLFRTGMNFHPLWTDFKWRPKYWSSMYRQMNTYIMYHSHTYLHNGTGLQTHNSTLKPPKPNHVKWNNIKCIQSEKKMNSVSLAL